jgi:hypothetical protein
MSRNIGFALAGGFYDRRGDTIDPTDAERVELAIAALTHGTSRWLPDVLADLRGTLARDGVDRNEVPATSPAPQRSCGCKAAAKEREFQDEWLAKELYETPDPDGHGLEWPPVMDGAREWWLLRARRVRELTTNTPEGGA